MTRARLTALAATTAALTALLVPSSTATATSPAAPSASETGAARTAVSGARLDGQQLSQKMVRWARQGKSAVEMDRRLRRHGLQIAQPAAYDRRARLVAARSASGDITLNAPFLVHDAGTRWYWMANYSWDNTSFSEDMPATCTGYDRCDLLGKDAYGIVFDRNLAMTGYWATFGHRSTGLPSDRILDPAARSRYGVAYQKQDTVYKPSTPNDLDMYHGNVTVEIDGRPCGATEAWTRYAHTYGQTNMSGITINAGALSYTFSGEDKWTKASQPTVARRNC